MDHEHLVKEKVNCRILTVSTSRTDRTDKSGAIIKDLLQKDGHKIDRYEIIADQYEEIIGAIERCVESDSRVLIMTGGTGLSGKDQSVDVLMELEDKELPGFGEIFRNLSYADIGPRAILSRARGSVIGDTLIFALPGSPAAVELGMRELISPTLGHALFEMDKEGGKSEG